MAPTIQTDVSRLYQSVIDHVCTNTREFFRDKGVDEGTIQAFKKIWEEKVMSSKAVVNVQIQDQGVYMLQQGRPAAPMLPRNGMTYQLLHTRAARQAQGPLPEGFLFPTGDTRPQVAHVTRAGQLVSNQQILRSRKMSTSSQNKIVQLDGSADCHEDFNIKNQAGPSNLIAKPKTNKLVKRTDRGKAFRKKKVKIVFQFDGENDDTSSDGDDDDDSLLGDTGDISSENDDTSSGDTSSDEEDDESDEENGEVKDKTVEIEDEELCSDDDLSSEEDSEELFDSGNVVVCQYDKVRRIRSTGKWKFYLKVGIMNLNGIDHVFQKAVGEANW